MEQLAVQRVRAAVVAKVEAQHRVAAREEELREREEIEGFRAALPAVQQHGEPARRASAAGARLREAAHEAHALAAIEHELAARRDEVSRAALDRAAAEWKARQDGLQVPVGKPGRRLERLHRSTMLISMRLLA